MINKEIYNLCCTKQRSRESTEKKHDRNVGKYFEQFPAEELCLLNFSVPSQLSFFITSDLIPPILKEK